MDVKEVPEDWSASQNGSPRFASQQELDTVRMVSNLVAGVETRIIFGASSYGALDSGKRVHSHTNILI
jgi:hypothetical protein